MLLCFSNQTFSQEEKRRTAGPDNAQTVKGGGSTTERDIHRVENRLQQVGAYDSQTWLHTRHKTSPMQFYGC